MSKYKWLWHQSGRRRIPGSVAGSHIPQYAYMIIKIIGMPVKGFHLLLKYYISRFCYFIQYSVLNIFWNKNIKWWNTSKYIKCVYGILSSSIKFKYQQLINL